jgi:uncharacterized Fe-S cluster-containing radical SAM superfamily protein
MRGRRETYYVSNLFVGGKILKTDDIVGCKLSNIMMMNFNMFGGA